MKPLDQFLKQMMASTKLASANDAAGATKIIQRALRQAGLMEAPAADREAAQDEPSSFVDLNSVPTWSGAACTGRPLRMGRPPVDTGSTPNAQDTIEHQGRGQFMSGVFRCAAGRRRYKLYLPPGASLANRPLLVMLHGCTQNADDFALGTSMNLFADDDACIVLYPEQDRTANPSGCWNWFDAAQQSRDAGEPAILAAMTRQIMADHAVDESRVFVAGLSAGGAMAAILGATYPDLFAAVGIHSGLAAGSGKDMITGLHAMKRPKRKSNLRKSVPIIVFHGDADGVVHPENGTIVLRQFIAAQDTARGSALQERTEHGHTAGRAYTKTSWRHADGGCIAEHWLVHGAGHAWQGGQPAGSHTDPSGPCASKEMLAFFNGARRPATECER
ncbi:extracellular catalytic domain type 1 short-chain-length polyhydroxyalkanoate depolymerase [Pseudoduganella sp. HUAS MS19]